MFPNLINFCSTSQFPYYLGRESVIPSPFSRIQSLKLEIPNLSAAYIKYLTNRLPGSLKKLKIKVTGIRFHGWVQEIGEDQILQFATGLSVTGNIKLTATVDRTARRDEEARQQHQLVESKMTFYSVLNGIVGNRTLSDCSSSFRKGNAIKYVIIKLKCDHLIYLAYLSHVFNVMEIDNSLDHPFVLFTDGPGISSSDSLT
jgi:hypothetical protein